MHSYKENASSTQTTRSLQEILLFLYSFASVILSTELLGNMPKTKFIIRIVILTLLTISGNLHAPWHLYWKAIMFLGFASLHLFRYSIIAESYINIITFILLVIVISDLGLKKASITIIKGTIAGIIIVLIALYTGLLENKYTIDIIGRKRYYLGFMNPNYLSMILYSLIAYLFVIHKYKKPFVYVLLLLPILILTKSRSPLISLAVLLFTYCLMKRLSKKHKSVGLFILIMFTLAILAIAVLISFFPKSIISRYPDLNRFFSGRLSLYMSSLRNVTLIDIIVGGREINTLVDNFFLQTVLQFGIGFLSVFLITIILKVSKLYYENETEKAVFLISYITYGIVESGLTSPVIPASLLFWYIILI